MSQVEIYLMKGDNKNAFKILSNIKEDSPGFVKTQMVKAEIYYNVLNNKKRYIDCYQAIIKAKSNTSSYILAGDAFMKIRNPKLAIRVLVKS